MFLSEINNSEKLFESETGFDKKHKINVSTKKVNRQIIDAIEKEGVSLEMLESCGLPIFKYRTQITIHGIFDSISNYVGKYKNIIHNGNGSIGVKWSAVDYIKKTTIIKSLSLAKKFQIDNGFNASRTSSEFYITKHYTDVSLLKVDFEKVYPIVGNKSAYKIPNILGGGYLLKINVDGIYQTNLFTFINLICGISDFESYKKYEDENSRIEQIRNEELNAKWKEEEKTKLESYEILKSKFETTTTLQKTKELKNEGVLIRPDFDKYGYESPLKFIHIVYFTDKSGIKKAYIGDKLSNINLNYKISKLKKKGFIKIDKLQESIENKKYYTVWEN